MEQQNQIKWSMAFAGLLFSVTVFGAQQQSASASMKQAEASAHSSHHEEKAPEKVEKVTPKENKMGDMNMMDGKKCDMKMMEGKQTDTKMKEGKMGDMNMMDGKKCDMKMMEGMENKKGMVKPEASAASHTHTHDAKEMNKATKKPKPEAKKNLESGNK